MNNYNVTELINKYSCVLDLYNKKDHANLALLFEISTQYLKENYDDIDKNIKITILYLIKELYFKNLIESDIICIETINEFIKYYKENYNNFISDFDESINKDDINILFTKKYINK